MRHERWIFLAFVALSMLFFSLAQGCAPASQAVVAGGEGSRPPIITHSFAADRGMYGSAWKLYLEAEDPDGDMARIAAVADQVGYGIYPASWTLIRGAQGNRLRGYLQWNTFSSRASRLPEWTRMTVTVTVIDKAGNQSNEVVFPFTFESGAGNADVSRLPPPFDQGENQKLGYISIELRNSNLGVGR